jgi:hypothetical protein
LELPASLAPGVLPFGAVTLVVGVVLPVLGAGGLPGSVIAGALGAAGLPGSVVTGVPGTSVGVGVVMVEGVAVLPPPPPQALSSSVSTSVASVVFMGWGVLAVGPCHLVAAAAPVFVVSVDANANALIAGAAGFVHGSAQRGHQFLVQGVPALAREGLNAVAGGLVQAACKHRPLRKSGCGARVLAVAASK